MTDFNGDGFKVKEEVRRPKKSITPGIQVAKITDVVYGETSAKKTPYIRFTHMTAPVEGLVDENEDPMGQKANTTMWMSEGAWNIEGANWCTKARLTIMADKLGLSSEFAAIKGSSAEDFVNQVAKLFKGKKARWVFGGEEDTFTPEGGKELTIVRPQLNSFGFVESLTAVPNDEDTKLYFNEDKHIKRLEVADDTSSDDTSADASADTDDGDGW